MLHHQRDVPIYNCILEDGDAICCVRHKVLLELLGLGAHGLLYTMKPRSRNDPLFTMDCRSATNAPMQEPTQPTSYDGSTETGNTHGG